MSPDDPIKHVVVLMMENHSFDQMLGSLASVHAGLDGVDPANLKNNPDYPDASKGILQSETKLTSIPIDPAHEFVNVNHQLANNCGGFVRDYVQAHPNSTDQEKSQIMGFYPLDFLPVYTNLPDIFWSVTDGSHRCPVRPGPTDSSFIAVPARGT